MSGERQSRRGVLRRLAWAALAVVVGVGGGLLWSLRSPAEPLDAERLAAARELWRRHGPSDYAIELELSGALSDRRRIVVRDGEVVEMTTSGVRVPRPTWSYWTVEGMLGFLEDELDNRSRPERAYGVSDPEAVVLNASFHPELGYPTHFLRHVMGKGRGVEWRVVAFEAGAGE